MLTTKRSPTLSLHDKLLKGLKDNKTFVSDQNILEKTIEYFDGKKSASDWRQFSMFWPPRIVAALQEHKLVCFVGAGLSVSAGAPLWADLLRDHLKISKTYIEDEELKSDPLTLAEIASHRLGSNLVQDTLRNLITKLKSPTTSHLVMASLQCPIYVTTNYDNLLENAWHKLNLGQMKVVVNDADLAKLGHNWFEEATSTEPIIFKIHGCIDRKSEQLILTRHDYRHHYRTNENFFTAVRNILAKRHVLFAGFSHRDPEVTRLVDDAIFSYELNSKLNADVERPNFYSLQFEMLDHTPEIFAARGIVALRPPYFPENPNIGRSLSLTVAIGELAHAHQLNLHKEASLDDSLKKLSSDLRKQLDKAVDQLKKSHGDAVKSVTEKQSLNICNDLLKKIPEFATQGVYLVNRNGDLVDYAVPIGLLGDKRKDKTPSFFERPYFRIAKSFREPFISDSFRSIFNDNSTIAICVPLIVQDNEFVGLLFAALQMGAWNWMAEKASEHWKKGKTVLLVDSNGIALLPPKNEFQPKGRALIKGEKLKVNKGYSYVDLFTLSRRDVLIRHIVDNIVPLGQDDDVFELGADLDYYSVVTEVPGTRWKLAISKPYVRINDA